MFSFAMPFTLCNEMFKLNLQTSQMLMSSGEVIAHRNQMIAGAMAGKISWNDPEFTKLWQEKITAYMESYASMSKSMFKKTSFTNADMEKNMIDGIKALTASSLPYHAKAGENAKRLRNKKVK